MDHKDVPRTVRLRRKGLGAVVTLEAPIAIAAVRLHRCHRRMGRSNMTLKQGR